MAAKVKIEVTIASWWQKVDEPPKDPEELLGWFKELRGVTNKFRAELKRRETNLEKEGFKEFNPDWKPTIFSKPSKARIKAPTQEQIEAAQKEATDLMVKLKWTPTLREFKKFKEDLKTSRINEALRAAGIERDKVSGEFYRRFKQFEDFDRFSQGSDDAFELECLLKTDEDWQEKLEKVGLEEVIQEWLTLRSTPKPGNPEDVI